MSLVDASGAHPREGIVMNALLSLTMTTLALVAISGSLFVVLPRIEKRLDRDERRASAL
jgi:hypothetical protein